VADYQIIDNRRELEALVPRLLTEPAVAFDTEADSFYHYREKICLLQVATPSRPQFAYLIDPLAMGGPANLILLAPVFASEQIRVIFHAAEYDLFLLKRDCGISIANLFDTMISAQLLGYPSIGLAALAKAHFDVTLPKEEQRSDWSTRPLSEEQLRYAAMDVYYLVELAERLDAELHAKARWSWAQEEFLALCNREVPARTFDEYGYLKLKGARHLPPRNLSVLRELYVMRDAEARQIDRPAFMILSPNTIIDLAERAPRTKLEIAKTKGVGEKTLRRLGTQILTQSSGAWPNLMPRCQKPPIMGVLHGETKKPSVGSPNSRHGAASARGDSN